MRGKTVMGGRYETKEIDHHFLSLTISYLAFIVKAICSLTHQLAKGRNL